MEDEQIIELFFARSEQAISELDRRYGKLCHRIARNILNNYLDAEECVNDAYLGIWHVIPPQKPDPLSAFVIKFVRNRSISRRRANTAMKRNSAFDLAMEEIAPYVSDFVTIEERIRAKELARWIESFLDTLSKENRVIFLRRYWFSDSYADIARQTGLSEKNISVRLTRIRKQLRKYLMKKEAFVCVKSFL